MTTKGCEDSELGGSNIVRQPCICVCWPVYLRWTSRLKFLIEPLYKYFNFSPPPPPLCLTPKLVVLSPFFTWSLVRFIVFYDLSVRSCWSMNSKNHTAQFAKSNCGDWISNYQFINLLLFVGGGKKCEAKLGGLKQRVPLQSNSKKLSAWEGYIPVFIFKFKDCYLILIFSLASWINTAR